MSYAIAALRCYAIALLTHALPLIARALLHTSHCHVINDTLRYARYAYHSVMMPDAV